MTDQPAAPPVTETNPAEEAARQRAADCGKEIEAVCAKHNCTIRSFLNPLEGVGEGSKALITTGYGIFPLA